MNTVWQPISGGEPVTEHSIHYNLVVRVDQSKPMPDFRFFEGTKDHLKNGYSTPSGEPDLNELAKLPTILVPEFDAGDTSARGCLGYMDLPSKNPRITSPLIEFPAQALLKTGILAERMNTRTRWAVCEGDPFRALSQFALRAPAPKSIERGLVAVMMTFNEKPHEDPVYSAVRKAASRAGFHCVRVDQLSTPTNIVQDIWSLIDRAEAVLVDLSGANSNVLYELGLAHGKEKPVIQISSDNMGSLPFDIAQRRTVGYERTDDGLSQLALDLENDLCQVFGHGKERLLGGLA